MYSSNVSPTSITVASRCVPSDVITSFENIDTQSDRHYGVLETVSGNIQGAREMRAGAIRTVSGDVFVGMCSSVGNVSSIGGEIFVHAQAKTGKVSTLCGSIWVGGRAQVRRLASMSGGVCIGDRVCVDGDVRTWSGDISVGRGTRVAGNVSTMSGDIELRAAQIVGGIRCVRNYAGADPETHRQAFDATPQARALRVVIGPHTVVEGPLHSQQPIRLYIHRTAKTGPIIGAEPIVYATRQPPPRY